MHRTIRTRLTRAATLALALGALTLAPARAAAQDATAAPAPPDSAGAPARDTLAAPRHETPLRIRTQSAAENEWRRAAFGDELITHPDPWRARHPRAATDRDLVFDYNRVDLVRYGLWWQAQRPETMLPRIGARAEYATGRRRPLYGVLVEQPLLPTARFVLGFGAVRRTDHPDLQQISDDENSLLLLFAHEDWRDYFEREGVGAYLSWRVPDFSTVSVHWRDDHWRSVAMNGHVVSWFRREHALRGNPAIDDGESRSVFLRLERLGHRRRHDRGGLYHWIELERSGGALGGDFTYTRALADVRSVLRVLPATTLSLRGVAGASLAGALPRQREFTIGGADGLRAHAFGSLRGDHVALAQAEYSVGMDAFRLRPRHRGMQALVFVDTGAAWTSGARADLARQRFAVDAGVGFATPDDDFRVTLARDLQDPDARAVVAARLQRPF